MRTVRFHIAVALVLLIPVVVAAQPKVGDALIRNGTLLTVTKGTLENTDLLIRDGKIAAIGRNLTAPEGCRIIDATGLFVMPGIIDAHSHIALEAINEMSSPVTPEIRMRDALNPLDIAIYRALAGGVTTIQTLHGSANAIGGQSVVMKLRYGTVDPSELVLEGAPRGIKFALGENPTRVHGAGHNIVPRTRMGVEFVIRSALMEAREYRKQWDEYNEQKKKRGFRGAPPRYDDRLEVLAEVLRGNITIHCHCYRADEIVMILNVCRDFGIKKLVLQHANEGFKVAPEIADFGAMASVFSDAWAYKFEVYYSTAYNAAILTRNGVVTSINSDDPGVIRHLYHEASKTLKYGGLSREEALALITINPAKQLGIDSRVGSLEVGKDGDVAIFREHPLSIYTVPVMTLVDGIVRFDRENDPDDMRIYVDPEERFDQSGFSMPESFHDCLGAAAATFNQLFENR
ncbi:MAG: amidohydrolase [Cyclobacteriaceae bacterium]|jgi:imidazolonepropionase-like amidohydrolase|nr:amidohydrolase [Cyclobacteriaceae bacterium]